MNPVCLPHTQVPGTSSLLADYLYHFDRVRQFYDHAPLDPQALANAAHAIRYPDERRLRLVAALRKLNGDSPVLNALELPDTVAVVTGQQVGLFGGPAYTIYKALTAVRLARQLTAGGIRAVPVFWMATEDHDFAEIDHAYGFDVLHRPVGFRAGGNGQPGQPVGGIPVSHLPLAELSESFEGFLYREEVMALVEESYQTGRTFGESFFALLRRLLAGYGVVFLDPLEREIREIAAPFLREALGRAPQLSTLVAARNRLLQERGYHAQVHFEDHTSFFFRLVNGRRVALRRSGQDYFEDTRRVSEAELAGNPVDLSPNALLRPVMQDYLLPTAAYVGGPAELAYLAQSQVLYHQLLGRSPVAVLRAGFTLLDDRSRNLMDRYGLHITDCFQGEAGLRDKIAERLIPSALEQTLGQATTSVAVAIDQLQLQVTAFDPTLGEAVARSRAKILYQIEKNHRKIAREALRREQRAADGASHLAGLVFPEKHLQERYYSILPFLAKHGLDLVDRLFEGIQQGCPDHLLLSV